MSKCCLGLVACLLLGGAGRSADDKWKTFTSKEGKFSVSLPSKPVEQTKKIPTAVGQLDLYLFIAAPALDRVYLVSYSDYPKAAVKGNMKQAILDGVRKGNLQHLRGKLVSEKKIALGKDKNPGREILIEMPDKKNFYRARIFLVANRLYQIVVLGPDDFAKGKKADDYLNSFKLAE